MVVMHTQLTSESVLLHWSPPPAEHVNGIIRAFVVIVTELETQRISNYTLFGMHVQLHIPDLHPFYGYNFSVCAVTVAQGPCTALYSLQTLEDGECTNTN